MGYHNHQPQLGHPIMWPLLAHSLPLLQWVSRQQLQLPTLSGADKSKASRAGRWHELPELPQVSTPPPNLPVLPASCPHRNSPKHNNVGKDRASYVGISMHLTAVHSSPRFQFALSNCTILFLLLFIITIEHVNKASNLWYFISRPCSTSKSHLGPASTALVSHRDRISLTFFYFRPTTLHYKVIK